MRAMWKGTISFGMMVIPVKLGTAVSSEDLELHQVRRSDGSRIGYERYAKADGKPVEYEDVAKGYESPDGSMVILEDADFELAYGQKNRAAKITSFTSAKSLPRTAHRQSYLVQPDKGGEQAYALLARVLWRTDKAGVVHIALGTRQALALLYATGNGYLMLERLQWAADVKVPDFQAPEAYPVDDKQVELAEAYIAMMTEPFDWQAQADTSMEALRAVIDSKLSTGQGTAPAAAAAETGTATTATDMIAALTASIEAKKAELAKQAKPAQPARTRKPRSSAGKAAA